mmetsp:Transcript_27294/g.88184  ORF Transcript_27294/g.88184 Transcript_27294/m.88184 type:complete len:211 (-) Transcript_27294:30-662(-)
MGPKVDTSMPGKSSPRRGSSLARFASPKKFKSGKFTGKLYWPGVYQTWASGKFRQNWPKNALCSMPSVGSTTCFTSPWAASSFRSSSRHSAVGAFGAYASRPSSTLTTIMRTGTWTYTIPWSWSNAHTSDGTTSVTNVFRCEYGAIGSTGQLGFNSFRDGDGTIIKAHDEVKRKHRNTKNLIFLVRGRTRSVRCDAMDEEERGERATDTS